MDVALVNMVEGVLRVKVAVRVKVVVVVVETAEVPLSDRGVLLRRGWGLALGMAVADAVHPLRVGIGIVRHVDEVGKRRRGREAEKQRSEERTRSRKGGGDGTSVATRGGRRQHEESA